MATLKTNVYYLVEVTVKEITVTTNVPDQYDRLGQDHDSQITETYKTIAKHKSWDDVKKFVVGVVELL